jgi:hypothetical protein
MPVTALFTPRYFPSNPGGILLKNNTELDVLNIENAITIRHDDIIASGTPEEPVMIGIEIAGINTAKILGMCARVVDRSSPILDMTFGATKKISNMVTV